MGIARSGKALAKVLSVMGARLFLSDKKTSQELSTILRELAEFPLEAETGGHTDRVYQGKDLIIISPGVSIKNPILEKAKENGVPIISEVEMAFLLSRAPFIAITGTNGKSTTSTLTHKSILADGKFSHLAGNIGNPLVEEVLQIPPHGWITAEISSFQLEAVEQFRPRIAALLNVTTDHLDRHADFREYLETKGRIFSQQRPEDYAVLNADDAGVMSLVDGIPSRKFFFSRTKRVETGAFLEDGFLKTSFNGEEKTVAPWDSIPLKGLHNLENVLATICIARAAGVRMESVLKALEEFKPLHYRMEYVDTIRGVEFYNDSKGTNPDAVRASLFSFEKPLILIAGGTDKGLDFLPLAKNIKERAKGAVLIGQSRGKIAEALASIDFSNYFIVDDMSLDGFKGAIKKAWDMAPEIGVVLLSPSCASFDMFNHAEHRGEMFNKFVGELKAENEEAV